MKRSVAAALALALAGAVSAQVDTTPSTGATTVATSPAQDSRVTRGDRVFMEQAARSGLFEVEVSRLAAARAADPGVRAFAAMLVEHHTAVNQELSRLALARNVKLPGELPKGLREDIDKLGRLSGAAFDAAYIRQVGIQAHQKDVARFEQGSLKARDAELKAWIDNTLPTLRDHLAQALKLPQSGRTPAMER